MLRFNVFLEVIIPSGGGNKITPVIPKAFAKRFQIQKDHVSTPKLADLKKDETVQDMIKNAFGFDSEEDEDDMSGGESIISPVKKMATSFLEVSKPYDSRYDNGYCFYCEVVTINTMRKGDLALFIF